MSSSKKIQPTKYAELKYNSTAPVDFDIALKYSGALLAIAGADGELADAELQWYLDEAISMGVTQEYIDAVRNIDWKNVNIEEALSEVKFDFTLNGKRVLLYHAIKMSRADGVYHEKEKAAVARAANILGVSQSVVQSLESVAEMEDSTTRLLRLIFSSDA
ncbi:MAG: TerB family tellurite resistance protein [Hormoscilla sp. GUM202]|nr:TerB family tellurite resistance protein [Hormoscilla sp. GUM202]